MLKYKAPKNQITWTPRRGDRDTIDGQPGNYRLQVRRDRPSAIHAGWSSCEVHQGDTRIFLCHSTAQAKHKAEFHLRRTKAGLK